MLDYIVVWREEVGIKFYIKLRGYWLLIWEKRWFFLRVYILLERLCFSGSLYI